MRASFDSILSVGDGVASRRQLAVGATRAQLDEEIRRGDLVRVAPHAYARPWDADTRATAEAAALKSTGGICSLSHTTALRRWNLPTRPGGPIHVTALTSQRPRPRKGVQVHRTRLPIESVVIGGAATVLPAWAIIGSWPLHSGAAQRAPLIRAVAGRIVDAADVRKVLDQNRRLRGRAELEALLGLVESGCHSELELWGYLNVFDIPELRGGIRQRSIVIAGKTYRIDLAYEAEKLAVELDGREYHASTDQWESDIERDFALATVGWQTVRLSHYRMTTEVDRVQRDLISVRAARRPRR